MDKNKLWWIKQASLIFVMEAAILEGCGEKSLCVGVLFVRLTLTGFG